MGDGAKIILTCVLVVAVTVFLICVGIATVWIAIEDTALGRAIDEIMEERIERWKERATDEAD